MVYIFVIVIVSPVEEDGNVGVENGEVLGKQLRMCIEMSLSMSLPWVGTVYCLRVRSLILCEHSRCYQNCSGREKLPQDSRQVSLKAVQSG